MSNSFIVLDTCNDGSVTNNAGRAIGEHGAHLIGTHRATIMGNTFDVLGWWTAVGDGVLIDADADNNMIQANTINGDTGATRWGINIANGNCNNNVVVGNRTMGTYDSGTINDSGTGSTIGINYT